MSPVGIKTAQRLVGAPVEFRQRLERWGPTFVKIGQYLALRPDLIRDEYADELMLLFDRTETFAWSAAEQTLASELGPNWGEHFARFERAPFASGSLAQVHRAWLQDGTEVAVKILRPGLQEMVARDLRRGRLLATLLDWSGVVLAVSPVELLDELGGWLRAELDLKREAANLARMYRLSGSNPSQRVPGPFPEFSSARVLTTEFLAGEPVSAILEGLRTTPYLERERLGSLGINLELVAERLLQATLRQIFEDRFFHADPHPGNLLITGDNQVGYVDFGLCDTLDETIAGNQMRYLRALYKQDAPELLRAMESILLPGEQTDMTAFRRDFLDETDRWITSRTDTVAGADNQTRSPAALYMVRAMRVIRRHRLRIPTRSLSMYRTLLTAETVAGRLAPGVDLAVVGRSFFAALERRKFLSLLDPERLQEPASELIDLLRSAPARVNQVLGDMANGDFALKVQVADDAFTRRARTRYARITVTAILSIGVALLLTRSALPVIYGIPLDRPLLILLGLLYLAIFIQWRRLPW